MAAPITCSCGCHDGTARHVGPCDCAPATDPRLALVHEMAALINSAIVTSSKQRPEALTLQVVKALRANPDVVLRALGGEPIGNTFKDGQVHTQWRVDTPVVES